MGIRHYPQAGSGSGAGGLINGADYNAEHISEWTQIATSGTLSGATYTFSSIPQTYADLWLVLNGVSHNNGSNAAIQVRLSDGVWTSGTGNMTASGAASALFYGGILFTDYTAPIGIALVVTAALTPPANYWPTTSGGPPAPSAVWTMPGGITEVRLSLSAGSFDAGVATLYGR